MVNHSQKSQPFFEIKQILKQLKGLKFQVKSLMKASFFVREKYF